jgi:thioredoxin 1
LSPDATFEDDVLRADRPVIVDLRAQWCMPCPLVAPVLEEIAEEQAGHASWPSYTSCITT